MLAGDEQCTHNAEVTLTSNVKDAIASSALELSVPDDVEPAAVDNDSGRLPESDEANARVSRKEFEFPGNLASVTESRERVMQFVCEHCSDEGDRIDILVALQEALANATVHGCGDDATKRIECAVEAGPSEIVISVRDPGPGFDLALADPENFAATKRASGRGICLMRSLMTEVAYGRGGSELRMRKHFERG